MNDPIRHRATASDDTLPSGLDLDFDAIDEAGDELLDRCLFQIRASLTDFRNL
jgi:hypothetical protein